MEYIGLNMALQVAKKEKIYKGAQRQKIIARNLEYNLYFNKKIKDFNKKALSFDELYKFRKDLKDKRIEDLSAFWNDFINLKIAHPNLKLPKLMSSGACISTTKVGKEEFHMIYVYPETTVRDVISAFGVLQDRIVRADVQPLGKLGDKVYDIVYEGLDEGRTTKEIFNFIDEKIDFVVDRKTVEKIIRRMKKGL